jgi:hypothetical protein
MKALNLTLHCGGHEVTTEQITNSITPNATESWHPIPHSRLIEGLRGIVADSGMEIVQERHALARDGQRYFGLFQVSGVPNFSLAESVGTIIGLRNSHDKSFPAGINAGSAPFVCDNLAFHNEVKIARRHTKFILRDLPMLLSGAFGQLTSAWGNHAKRVDAYQGRELCDKEAHDVIVRAYRCGAVSKTALADVVQQWHDPEHAVWGSERNLWGLHNAFTNVLRGNAMALPRRSDALHALLDPLAGIAAQQVVEAQDAVLVSA